MVCPTVTYKAVPDLEQTSADLGLAFRYLDLANRSGDYDLALVHLREMKVHMESVAADLEWLIGIDAVTCSGGE